MAGDNSAQIEEWNGPLGDRWAELQHEFDAVTQPFGDAVLKAAAVKAGERVLDVGCGCGTTTLALGAAVGPGGAVLGVDISRPMLAVARRKAPAGAPVSYLEADASSANLPAQNDLIFSRFGVMFFSEPVQAFANLRRSLKETGRIAFVCWQAAKDNPWATIPVMAAREALDIPAPPPDPHAPGPFAFGDASHVRTILLEAGFSDVRIEPFEAPVHLGADPTVAADRATRMGPVSRIVREAGAPRLPKLLAAIEAAFTRHATAAGVSLPGRAWIVEARAA